MIDMFNPLRKTDFLYKRNGFIIGIGSIMNIFGNYFNYDISKNPEEIDSIAIESDWQKVGEDIKEAKNTFENQHSDELCVKP